MPDPDKIPLSEAAARGLLPCVLCGAPGADVHKVGGKGHLLCPACARRGRGWTSILAGLVLAVALLGGYLLLRPRPGPASPPPDSRAQDPDPWMKETTGLMKMGKWREARARIQTMLEPLPKQPVLNMMMAQCLMRLKYFDAAVPHLLTAMEEDPDARKSATVFLGIAYQSTGRAALALPQLEQPTTEPLDELRRLSLAECYLDLERYDDVLKALPPDPQDAGSLWARHRAFVYQGKAAEALRLLEGHDAEETATFRAAQLREEGDFDGARKVLSAMKPEPSTVAWHRLKRAELALHLESGDLARLEDVARELSTSTDAQVRGEAIFIRSLAHLLGGRADAARAGAWEFLAKTDPEFAPIRLERMMMRHLAGELKDADLEAEAKRVSRFHANDLYWYLAVATGDRGWAGKARDATPGRNYPYHAIQRLLRK